MIPSHLIGRAWSGKRPRDRSWTNSGNLPYDESKTPFGTGNAYYEPFGISKTWCKYKPWSESTNRTEICSVEEWKIQVAKNLNH